MKAYITGTRRGLGYELSKVFETCDSLEECNVFINCKHDGVEQVRQLYHAVELGVNKIINIGSNSPDCFHPEPKPYAVMKAALDHANDQLFELGHDTTIIRYGYFDSERTAHIDAPKMEIDYAVYMVKWVLHQPYRVKEVTVCV